MVVVVLDGEGGMMVDRDRESSVLAVETDVIKRADGISSRSGKRGDSLMVWFV